MPKHLFANSGRRTAANQALIVCLPRRFVKSQTQFAERGRLNKNGRTARKHHLASPSTRKEPCKPASTTTNTSYDSNYRCNDAPYLRYKGNERCKPTEYTTYVSQHYHYDLIKQRKGYAADVTAYSKNTRGYANQPIAYFPPSV
jgi:hypothetical protein